MTRRRPRNICVRGGAAQRQNAGQLPASPRSIILKNGPHRSSWGTKVGRVQWVLSTRVQGTDLRAASGVQSEWARTGREEVGNRVGRSDSLREQGPEQGLWVVRGKGVARKDCASSQLPTCGRAITVRTANRIATCKRQKLVGGR